MASRKLKLDLTGVESYTKASEGIHTCKIASIELTTSQGGDDMLKVTYEVIKGADKGCKVFDNIVLTEKALWKLKALLQALGMKCDGKIALDLDKLEGKVLDVTVVHEEYNGQMRAKVSETSPAGKASSKADDDEDFDEDDEELDDEEEEEAPKKPAKKADKKKPAPKAKKKPEPEEDEDDDEDWDEDEDEEEEVKPAKKSSKKPEPKKKATPKKKPEPEEDDEDDDDDEDWEEA